MTLLMFSEQAQGTLRGLGGEGERVNRQMLAGLERQIVRALLVHIR